jgi:hypothetical protein
MKKILLITFLLLSFVGSSQIKLDALDFQGKVTTTIRNAYDVPTGHVYVIWNTTTGQFEYAEDDDVWKEFGAGGIGTTDQTITTTKKITINDGQQLIIEEQDGTPLARFYNTGANPFFEQGIRIPEIPNFNNEAASKGYVDSEISSIVIDTTELADNSVTTDKILDGTIVNADVNASAAIAGTKLAVAATPDNYTAGSATVEAHFVGIDTELGVINSDIGELDTTVLGLAEDVDEQNTRLTNLESPLLDMAAIVTNYTTITADAKRLVYSKEADEVTVTINDTLYPPKTTLLFNQRGAGAIKIDYSDEYKSWTDDNSVDLYYVQTDSIFQSLTMVKDLDSVWQPMGKNIKYYTFVTPNLYTNLDAANVDDETNATTNWSASSGNIQITSSTSFDPVDGTYLLYIQRITTNNVAAHVSIPLGMVEDGKTYKLTVSHKRTSGSENLFVSIRDGSGTSLASSGPVANTWGETELNFTADETAITLRAAATSATDIGNSWVLDKITLIEIIP